MDPLPVRLADLTSELAGQAVSLGARLHPQTAANLAEMVRMMNCYYSNLIEGHNTRPRDIERALGGDLEVEPERRSLQLEALAHIKVQRSIDAAFTGGTLTEPASVPFLTSTHRAFYAELPSELLRVEGTQRSFTLTPGEFRTLPEHEVSVGRHLPPSSAKVAEFMRHFEQRYRLASLGRTSRMVAMAAAHHRFNFIHPFPDGNGRVSRLMSHAIALEAGIGAHGLWSISRGLARGLKERSEYRRMMDLADSPRRGDLDGRGNLSQQALEEFVHWFLQVALDQVTFMGALFQLETLSERLSAFALDHLRLKQEAAPLLEEVLIRGELQRGDAPRATGLKDRAARAVLGELVEVGLLGSATPKGPVSIRFPDAARDVLFPRLFLEA
ncbi:MAG: Fic family protein [Myxococcota bacterium]|nr:Fic family protein [Myxococcota bacterium]